MGKHHRISKSLNRDLYTHSAMCARHFSFSP
jgi:hypothetical protein